MNVGQWSSVFYSPVNLDYQLEIKVLTLVKETKYVLNNVTFLMMIFY
jgi:hypothetical protein